MNPNDKVFFSLRADLEYSQELDSSTDVGRMEIAHELRILNEAIEGVFEGNAVYLQLNLRDLSALRDKLITRKVDINGRKVNYTIDPNGCLIPKNKPRKDKYVVISINGEQVYLHQESYRASTKDS